MRLFAGPFVGEFGWELFCWQGHLRYLSSQYDEIIVAGKFGHSVLYKDFCSLFVPVFGITGPCRGPFNLHYIYNDLHSQYNPDKVIPPQTKLGRYRIDCRHEWMAIKQRFIKLGKPNAKYDILIHARQVPKNSHNDTSYRNWNQEKWEKVVEHFQDFKIASIGTEADHIKGTDDLRGIHLCDLVDYMAGAKVCVGPSSGPMHLASLCKCTQVVWWGDVSFEKKHSLLNRYRYLTDWNPFRSKVVIVSDVTFDPNVFDVVESIKNSHFQG